MLTERVRWGTAFKLVVFMPMAISMLAAGIIFRLVYEQDPDQGVANAVWVGVHDTFAESSACPGARPRPSADLAKASGGGSSPPRRPSRAGDPALHRRWSASPPKDVGGRRRGARPAPSGRAGKVTGTVWLDFTPGGGGKPDVIDTSEKALPDIKVEAVKDGKVVASRQDRRRRHVHAARRRPTGPNSGCPPRTSRQPYNGVDWLGPTLVTPAIIGSYVWMWAGFAMVLIAAGLAGVPRELLEAARVDGANEWQVFRRITVPLLAPVLGVVSSR